MSFLPMTRITIILNEKYKCSNWNFIIIYNNDGLSSKILKKNVMFPSISPMCNVPDDRSLVLGSYWMSDGHTRGQIKDLLVTFLYSLTTNCRPCS